MYMTTEDLSLDKLISNLLKTQRGKEKRNETQ